MSASPKKMSVKLPEFSTEITFASQLARRRFSYGVPSGQNIRYWLYLALKHILYADHIKIFKNYMQAYFSRNKLHLDWIDALDFSLSMRLTSSSPSNIWQTDSIAQQKKFHWKIHVAQDTEILKK